MSTDKDMSLTPISPTPASTSNQIDQSVPTVELSFNTSKGGAWDDRELIKASEAAMKEFHIHHPGPGSWLDKATAALAAGKKLPGADDFGTAWYSASLPDETQQPEASTSTLPSTSVGTGPADPYNANSSYNQNQNQNSNKRRRTRKSNGYDNQSNSNSNIPNPYAPSTSSSSFVNVNANGGSSVNRRGRGVSPIYQPPSPNGNGNTLVDEEEEDEDEYLDEEREEDDEEEEEEYDEDAEWEIPNSNQYRHQEDPNPNPNGSGYDQLFPSLGVYPPGGINREEALGYAMTAQYWAGYWMGVAQSQQQPQQQQAYRPNRENQVTERSSGSRSQGKSKKRKNTKQVDFAPETNLNGDEEEGMDEFIEPDLDGEIQMQDGRQKLNGNNPSNIKITKKQFDRPILDLRR